MATKSFLLLVVLKDTKLANRFVDALSESAEKANFERYKQESIELSRPYSEIKGEDIKEFFGVK